MKHLGLFLLRTLKAFRANQGLLMAGAVAYYALPSIVPLLILIVIGLSHVIDQMELLDTLTRYLEWVIPGSPGRSSASSEIFSSHRLAALGDDDLLQLLGVHGAGKCDVRDLRSSRCHP